MSKSIFKFVSLFFLLMLVSFSQNSYAQLSGPYTIPGTPFATIKAAFDSLNLVGVGGGGVTFNVTAGSTETVSDSVFILTATGTASNTIIFQKSGVGANPLITRTDAGTKTPTALGAQGDAVIIIQGSDYVTFDGIDVAASQSTIEYGYYLRKVSGTDGCKYVTIKNSVIDMTKGTSAFVAGIYSSNNTSGSLVSSATGITITSTGGRNEFVTLTGNTIQDVHAGIVLRGFNHTVAPNDFQDYNFIVGASGQGNTIQNYAGGNTGTTYGIYLINHTNPTVSYNTINNAGGGGVNATGQIYGIFMSATTTNVNRGGDVVMNNNVITLGISVTTSVAVNSINIAPISTSITVNNNTFGFGTFTTIGATTLISISQNTPSITVTGNQTTGTITKTGASGNFTCLNYSGSPVNGTVTMANNNFSNISLAGTSAFTGISTPSGSFTIVMQCYNNTISNITMGSGNSNGINLGTTGTRQVYSNIVSNITSTGSLNGINLGASTTAQVYNNIINNITSTGTTIVGLLINAGNNGTVNCYKNQVYNVASTNAATTTSVGGIQLNSGLQVNLYNNFISDLRVPSTTSTGNALFGINASASNATNKFGIYFNTIYLNSTGASAYRSFGIFSNTGSTSELRNNIVVNTSTGIPVAYGRSSTALGTYSAASDNNDFFATNIFWDGTTLYPTLVAYKTFVYPKDQASFSENPPFVNAGTAPYDLHMQIGIATQTERGGRPVSTPVAITDDFDDVSRNASFPDVGADEFSGQVLDLTSPIIAYTPFDNTSSLSDRTLVVNVSDQAGVPTAAPGWPTLYWKKGVLGLYSAVAPSSVTGSDYTFNFGSGVVPTDTVFYYLVARDTVPTTPNLRAFPTIGAGNYTFDPPAAGIPPTTPSSYRITNSSLAGDYTVGNLLFNTVTGRNITFEKSGDKWVPMENGQRYYGDLYVKKIEHPEFNYPDGTDGIYATITAAIADLNLRGVSSPVNFLLNDPSYTTGETFPIVVNITNEFKPTAVNTVTIKPNTSVTSLIQGAASNSALFKIRSNYVSINGSNSGGTDRSLTIENTSTVEPGVIQIASTGTTPITGSALKNCIIINANISTFGTAVTVEDNSSTPSFSQAGYFTNITLQNNSVHKSFAGISCNAVVTAGNGNGLLIESNAIDSSGVNAIDAFGITVTGVDGALITNNKLANIISTLGSENANIFLGSGTTNTTISNNIIGPINSTTAGPRGIVINSGNANSNIIVSGNIISNLTTTVGASDWGISVQGATGGVLIARNKISNIRNTNSVSPRAPYGIYLTSSLTAANITIQNNFIWDVAGYGSSTSNDWNGYGIGITGGGGYKIYNNSVSLSAEQTAVDGLPACLLINSLITAPASLDIRNNIFSTFQTVGTNRYAVLCKTTNSVFAFMDNNDYYTTGPNLGSILIGSTQTNIPDLTGWRTATGKDVNSIFGNPKFVSATNLHIDTNYDIVDGKGFYLSTVPQDIDGDTRNNPSDIGADEYTFIPPVDPTGVTASAISDAQIDVAFTPNVNNNNVVIVWNLTGLFSTPSGTPSLVDSSFAGGTVLYNGIVSPVNHTGRTASTTYYYKLFSYNGNYYSSGVTTNATTNASAIAPPYAQDFEGTFPPTDWTNYGTKTWSQSLTGGIGGSKCARVVYNPAGTANLQMPQLVFPASPLYRIKFWWKDQDISATMNGENSKQNQKGKLNKGVKNPGDGIEIAGYDTTYFEISTNGGTTWAVLAFLSADGPQANYTEVIQNLNSYAGQTVSIRWRDVSDGTFAAYGTGLDNITIEEIPACPEPIGLTATVITNNSANIGWSGATTVDIDYGTPGHPAGTGTVINGVTANPYTLGSLTAQTSYDVYVRQDCGGSFSTWSGPLSFTTACDLVLVPWIEDFESGVFPPNCWSVTGAAGLWRSGLASGYGTGTYSARADFYNIGSGSADLISVGYNASSLTNPILKFDWAYATYSGEVDQLDIYFSTDGGTTWTLLLAMPGGTNGILNPFNLVRTASYFPIASEWSTQSLSLPSGTNRVKFTASSAYGNNLYVDNIKVEDAPVPVFSISPSYKSFGPVYVGSSSANETFTITNTGVGTLTITAGNISIVGTDASQFVLTDANTYPINLTNGQTATVAVKFSPTSAGAKSADLQIIDNTSGSPHTAPLSGVGAATSAESYTFNGGFFRYGTISLTTGAFTSLDFLPQGSSYYPVSADNDTLNAQYAIMSDFGFPSNYYLWHIDFTTFSGDSIASVGPLASGQNMIKGMAYNKATGSWYVVSGNDFGSAAYLYTLNIATGALTVVGQIQNANLPVGMAIDCNGNAYIINVVIGTSSTAVLNSLNLTTAVATAIGIDLGLANVTGFSQDMDINPDNGNLYWSGYWSSGFFSEGGSFRLVNVATGTSTEISTFGQFETITGFNVNGICVPAATFQLSVSVTNGWNMVSTPGLNTPDQNVNTWWQYRDLGANVFRYSGGYQSVTDAAPGTGYWMKHSGDRTYNTSDEWPASGIQTVAHDPLTAASGWNLIGGYELSVQTANITTVPLGLQSGPVYKYSGGYQIATTLDPGYGYWIKLSGAGQIIIPETLAKGEKPIEWFPEDWGKIVLTDASGVSYTLYAVKGEVDLSQYEMPPAPMAGMFDIRFSSGKIAEDINSSMQPIDMSGITYPLTVTVHNMDIRLMDETGKNVNVNLKSGEDVVIGDASIQKLMVTSELIPAVYALEQNYPNPFNPSTVIEFSLPENVGNVQLSIYNALGEKVAELVNTTLVAGKYSYQWNAQNVATGMYIYELRTDKFVSVKKMVLLK